MTRPDPSDCLSPRDLLDLIAGEGSDRAAALARHAQSCEGCRRELEWILEASTAARALAARGAPQTDACLDDEEIAELAGGEHGEGAPLGIEHLASCARCRERLIAVRELIRDAAVATETRRLEGRSRSAWGARVMGAAAIGIVALGAAGAFGAFEAAESPTGTAGDPPLASEAHRESAITTTVAPSILGPADVASRGDSLRWTSVPHADRYQILIFNRDGTLVWDPQTPDTSLALPARLIRPEATTYLWKVEARTGWDRWVASEWEYLNVGPRDGSR